MRSRRRQINKPDLRIIRASEIGEYSYCSRAWWFKHVIRLPIPEGSGTEGRLAAGTRAHARHGRAVGMSVALRNLGIVLALCGVVAIALALLFGGG